MPALIIFIRNPEKGKVKTRLAKDLGVDQAFEVYLSLLEHTRQVATKVQARRMLFYSHFIDFNDEWDETLFEKYLQQGDDLGARMNHAFETALKDKPDSAVIIGSDCPQLDESIIEQAFAALNEFSYVLGPATDGGYYLLGMNAPSPFLFEEMAWSTSDVATQTKIRIARSEQGYYTLPELSDIDELDDWLRWKMGGGEGV